MKLEKFRYTEGDVSVVVLKFTGEFDTFNLPAFSERIDRIISLGDTRLVLDLHLLTFINSAALGYMIKTHKGVAAKGGDPGALLEGLTGGSRGEPGQEEGGSGKAGDAAKQLLKGLFGN